MIERLLAEPGVEKVVFDFSALGMTAPRNDGTVGPALKRTGVLTNAGHVAATLRKARCRRDHQHVVLENGKAKGCEVYPTPFCDAVCNGVRLELEDHTWLEKIYEKLEGANVQGTLSQVQEAINKLSIPEDEQLDDISWYKELYADIEFVDDITWRAA